VVAWRWWVEVESSWRAVEKLFYNGLRVTVETYCKEMVAHAVSGCELSLGSLFRGDVPWSQWAQNAGDSFALRSSVLACLQDVVASKSFRDTAWCSALQGHAVVAEKLMVLFSILARMSEVVEQDKQLTDADFALYAQAQEARKLPGELHNLVGAGFLADMDTFMAGEYSKAVALISEKLQAACTAAATAKCARLMTGLDSVFGANPVSSIAFTDAEFVEKAIAWEIDHEYFKDVVQFGVECKDEKFGSQLEWIASLRHVLNAVGQALTWWISTSTVDPSQTRDLRQISAKSVHLIKESRLQARRFHESWTSKVGDLFAASGNVKVLTDRFDAQKVTVQVVQECTAFMGKVSAHWATDVQELSAVVRRCTHCDVTYSMGPGVQQQPQQQQLHQHQQQ
jgi:hypothetical protein